MKLFPIDQHPDLIAAQKTLHELQAKHAIASAELEAVRQEARTYRLDELAANAIQGEPVPEVPDLQLANVKQRVAVLARAVELHQATIEGIRNRIDAAAMREWLPEYRTILARQAKLVMELAAAAQAETDFRDKLDDKGYSLRCGLLGLRHYTLEPHSYTLSAIADFIERGILDGSETFLHTDAPGFAETFAVARNNRRKSAA